ncbi:DsbA family protein [Fodinicola acaciae]|uniref:DsbA family protein n=1 Tax=Fodinicola acaciae TaxID=2681555 RepID=UPI0013D32F47|nr:thioredoxin domain-containing protein [Fodinicola acaciae]
MASKSKAREIAAKRLAAQRRRQRLVTGSVTGVIAVSLLVIAIVVGVVIYRTNSAAPAAAPAGTLAGITVGKASAAVKIDIYLDFMCPHCRAMEQEVGPTFDRYVRAGTVRVVYHPVAYLDDRSAGTRYSTRASAASACAQQAGTFDRFRALLFDNQPAEGSAGLTDDRLVALGRQAGATGADFDRCVRDGRYTAWTTAITDDASRHGVSATPTVIVAGKAIDGPITPATLTAAIEAAK